MRLAPTTATRRVFGCSSGGGSFSWGLGSVLGAGAGAQARLDRWRSGARRPARRSSDFGAQPPVGERLGGAQHGGGEGFDFGPGGVAAVGSRSWLDHRAAETRVERSGARYSATRSAISPLLGQGLVEEHRPGGAVGVEEAGRRRGRRPRARRRGWRCAATASATALRQRIAGPLHAGDVEPFLVAEVGVEQRLGHADRARRSRPSSPPRTRARRTGREPPSASAPCGLPDDSLERATDASIGVEVTRL